MILELNQEKINIIVATNYITRLRGLIGVSPIYYGMLFPKCNGIHTFFMKENIDVIALNQQNQVIYIYRNLPPNKILKIPNSNHTISILELPNMKSKSINMGDKLLFKDENVI